MGRRSRRYRQLLITSAKLGNTGNWNKKVLDGSLCRICFGRGYGSVAAGYVMTITRQQTGKLRINGSFPGIGKGVLSIPKRPDRLYGPLSRLSRGTGR